MYGNELPCRIDGGGERRDVALPVLDGRREPRHFSGPDRSGRTDKPVGDRPPVGGIGRSQPLDLERRIAGEEDQNLALKLPVAAGLLREAIKIDRLPWQESPFVVVRNGAFRVVATIRRPEFLRQG
jgi:hypothetical protein